MAIVETIHFWILSSAVTGPGIGAASVNITLPIAVLSLVGFALGFSAVIRRARQKARLKSED